MGRTDTEILLERYNVPNDVQKCVKKTFDAKARSLPSRNEIYKYVNEPGSLGGDVDRFMIPFAIRELYLENSFVAYNHEFMVALWELCQALEIKRVSEVLCGTGWLSHWMKKYNIPVKHSVDNKTWPRYNGKQFLRLVKRMDAVKHVKRCRKVDMFVMSWPYMDPVAAEVWKAMKPGAYLLYIGEDLGGCTADDEFFRITEGCVIETNETNMLEDAFVRFWGIHDRPVLFRKK